MSWWQVLPGLLALTLLWMVPGYAVLRLLGARGLLALGAGPAVTTGLSGVLAIGYGLLGVPWRLWTMLLGLALVVGLAALVGRLLGSTTDPAGVTVAGERRLRPAERLWLVPTWALGGGVLAAAMMTGMGRADQPGQAWDAVFHYNAVWFIRDTANASSLGGLSPMYADLAAPFYPAVWHGIVAVAPGFAGVTEAANASSIVLGPVIWIAGLVALARVVWPARALPAVLVPVLAASYVTFPAIAVSMLAVWPFALSTAMVPGTIALLIATLRRVLSWRMHLALGIDNVGLHPRNHVGVVGGSAAPAALGEVDHEREDVPPVARGVHAGSGTLAGEAHPGMDQGETGGKLADAGGGYGQAGAVEDPLQAVGVGAADRFEPAPRRSGHLIMESILSGGKGGPLIFGVLSVAGAAGEMASSGETTILNVPASMLLLAVAGTMIGFFLLPARDVARVTDHANLKWKRRLAYRVLTALPLVGVIICYAFLAAWSVQVGVGVVHTLPRLTIDDGLILPSTAVVGVGIRPWLPALLVAVERRATKVIGGES